MNEKVKNKKIITLIIITILVIGIIILSVINNNNNEKTIETSSNISNKKIEWGIKRESNHKQPDLGSNNKKVLEENNGVAIGNSEKKYIYLTFDEGYEAGYTPKILETLQNNNVKAAFFITAHYVNTEEELVKQMINEGHIVGNQLPPSQMYHILKKYKS